MILCPNCLHKEMVGAIFCGECGVQLIFDEGVPTTNFNSTTASLNGQGSLKPVRAAAPPSSATSANAPVSLNIISTGDIVPITGANDFTLGRVSESQPVIPDIDLTPYKAFEAGVSRMHASIKVKEDEVTVTDLDSANGTSINGRKVTPNTPYPLRHGDMLTLGKFKIQILLRGRTGG
jgi:pSer/pThr/pTyr-binding forkhead associated (FHA) protein